MAAKPTVLTCYGAQYEVRRLENYRPTAHVVSLKSEAWPS